MGGVLQGGGNEVGQAVPTIEAVFEFGEVALCMFRPEGVTAAAQGRLPACSITTCISLCLIRQAAWHLSGLRNAREIRGTETFPELDRIVLHAYTPFSSTGYDPFIRSQNPLMISGIFAAQEIVLKKAEIRFLPVAASGRCLIYQRNQLGRKANMISCRGKREAVRLISCDQPSNSVLRS